MLIYLFLFIYICWLIHRYDGKLNRNFFTVHYNILLVSFIMIAGLSYRLGTDSINYESSYYQSPNSCQEMLIWRGKTEIGWAFLNFFFSKLHADFSALKMTVAIIVNSTFFWFFKKYSHYFFTSILIYYLMQFMNMNFEVLRESLAISFFLIGYSCWIEKKSIIRYIIFVVIASCFHNFAFITILFPFVGMIKPNKWFIAMSFIALLTSSLMGSLLNDNLQLIAFNDRTSEIITAYLDSDVYGNAFHNINGLILICFQLILSYVLIKNPDSSHHEIKGLSLGYIIVTLLSLNVFILLRYNNYLFFPFAICLSNGINSINIKRHFGKLRVVAFFLLLFLSSRWLFNDDVRIRYIPYTSIINPERIPEREDVYFNY